VQMLKGQFQANIKLNKFVDDDLDKVKPVYTYQQHRLFLKNKGVTYFEDYQPRREAEDGSGAPKGNQPPSEPITRQKPEHQLNRNFSLPSLSEKTGQKKKMKTQKQEQEQMIFNEIFIQPRAQQLDKAMSHHMEKQQTMLAGTINRGGLPPINMMSSTIDNSKGDPLTKMFQNQKEQKFATKQKLQLSPMMQSRKLMEQSEKIFDKELNQQPETKENRAATAYSVRSEQESELLDANDPMCQGENHLDDIVKIVIRKFNSNAKLSNSASFFTQQIQVQPPEGLINSIGGNVKDSSWAPSIPVSTAFLKQTSLKDITLRAKAGVQAGDI
jgi:hypothetical protein